MITRWLTAAASGGGAFDPSQLSPKLWYDASDLSTLWQDEAGTTPVTSDGDPVRLVQDKSSSGLDLTPVSAGSYFVYRTSGGLHWLELSGSQYMEAVASKTAMAFAHQVGYTGCYGVRFGTSTNPGAAYTLLSNGGTSSGNTGINLWYDDRSGVGRNDTLVHLSGGPVTISAVSPDNVCPALADVVLSEITDPDNGTPADRHRIRVDAGTDQQSNSSSSSPSTADANADLVIGAASGSLGIPMVGRIYQFVMIEGQASGADRSSLESWVADKTGVTL